MQTLKLVRPVLIAALMMTTVGIAKAVAADAGNCGEYKYWRDGNCVDARDKPAGAWSETMSKRSSW
jgi:hypothetical protein